jgi:hypothetical protein
LPRIQEAQDGKRAVYFGDAAHFVWAPFLGYLWGNRSQGGERPKCGLVDMWVM